MKGGRADLVKKSTQTGKTERASTCERADKELKLTVTLGVNEVVRIAVPSMEVASKHACASVSERTSLTISSNTSSERTCKSDYSL